MIGLVNKVVLLCVVPFLFGLPAKAGGPEGRYDSYEGLVMAGYQGWHNAEGDGTGRGWYHYSRKGQFRPGFCTIDLWPDVSEYPTLYKTEFTYEDGEPAYIYSAHDSTTTDVHFRWMKEYGLDGVFMQRFVGELARPSSRKHFTDVLDNAMKAALKYDRAICIMYDLSGLPENGVDILLSDIKDLSAKYKVFDRKANPSYLYENGRPLVTVWGAGFNDNRRYGFDEIEAIVDGLRAMGFSVMIGVPTYWRDLTMDTVPDERLHAIIKKCDIIMPWFVGRYNQEKYPQFHELIKRDIAWAEENGIKYAPLCFPGFSWDNMRFPSKRSSLIPRNGGAFFKAQIDYCIDAGARMLYIAMFDEIDEGTAIYKLAERLPAQQDGSRFVPLDEGTAPDTYLKLAGYASKRLKKSK